MDCKFCGDVMDKVGPKEWECCWCHATAYGTEDDYYFDDTPEYSYDAVYGEDVGCKACGNPNYPRCKTSCKMFDD